MPSKARTALPKRPSAAEPPTGIGPAVQPTARQWTPEDVADLVNRDKLTVADGNALLTAMAEPPLKPARPATFAVSVAVRVPADTRPAAAMAHLDATVQRAVAAMTWTTLHDTDGYAIDAPHPPGDPAGGQPSTSGNQVQVLATVRLTVTVPAYVIYRFAGTASKLLDEDLQHLHDAGVETGPPRRAPAATDEDADDSPRLRSDRDDSVFYDYYGYHGDDDGPDESADDRDPVYLAYALDDGADLLAPDPAEVVIGLGW